MAEFNAGSIMGSLDIDTDPFHAGLDRAKADAAEFSGQTVTASADLDAAPFEEKAAKVTAETEALGKEDATVKVNADTSEATAKMALFKHSVDSASGAEGAGGGGSGMLYLIGLAASLAPALAPAVAAGGLFGSAMVAGMAQGGIALGAFMAVAKADFATLQTAIQKGTNLKGPAGDAEQALKSFDAAWKAVQKDTAGPVFGVMAKGLHDAAALLPEIEPLVVSTARGLSDAVTILDRFLASPSFRQFLDMIEKNAVPDIQALATTLTNFMGGFVNLIEGLNPITQIFIGNLQGISTEFLNWTDAMKNGGIQEVLSFIKDNGPEVSSLLHGLLTALADIGKGLAPLVGPALVFLNAFVKAVQEIHLAPLAAAFGSLLTALSPVLLLLGRLIDTILPPLSTLLGTLVGSFIEPLVQSLGQDLVPVIQALGGFLEDLAPPLGIFLASIANLVNPTGVGFLSTLIIGLLQAIEPLIVPVLSLATALEGLVDDALVILAPLIPPLTSDLAEFVKVVAPAIAWLAKIIALKPVADVILAIVAASYALKGAMVGLEIISTIIELLKAFSLASIADTVALKAMYIADGLVTVATAAWAVIQTVMDGIEAIFDAELWAAVAAELIAAAPFILIAAGVALLIVGIIELIKHWSTVWDWIKKIGDYIGHAFMDAWHAVASFFDSLGHDIVNLLGDAGTWLKNIGEDVLHGFLDGLKIYWLIIKTFYYTIPKDIVLWLAGAGSWLYNIGEEIINGLWNGMIAVWNNLVGWLQNAAGDIAKTFSSVLKVMSPSRVMMDIGKYTVMGLHQGFQHEFEQNFLPYVKKAVGSLVSTTTTGLTATATLTTSVNQTSTQTNAQIKDLTDSVNRLNQGQAELGATMATALAPALDTLTKAVTANDQSKTITDAFTKATVASTDTIIKAVRKR